VTRNAEGQWLTALVLVGVTVTTMVSMTAGAQRHPGRQALILLLACMMVFFLRRWPLPVLGVVTAVTAATTATGDAPVQLGFLLGLSLYFAALSLPRTRSIVVAAAVAVTLSTTILYSMAAVAAAQPAMEATFDFVPLVGSWFIADSVASRRRYQAGLAAQAEREEAAEVNQERVRIAREMHDVVAHALAVITVQAGVGRCLADQDPDQASSALASIETISRTAQDELRVVLGLLRDGDPGPAGAPLAPAPRLIDIKDLADTIRASGIPVQLRMEGIDRQLSPSLELSIYRVVQEALTNVVKHAPGARVAVELTVSAGKVRLDIQDDGRPVKPGSGTGHGITGMRERIGAFGGWLVAGPVATGGFQVAAEIPIEDVAS
jgi:signal transduction histidine kinase